MKKNPKVIAGLIAAVLLLAALIVLLTRMIPTWHEVQREMSLTPTPIPAMPDTVRAVELDPNAPTPMPVLRNGSQETELVRQLQSRLRELGYYEGEVDGQFGNGTRDAVKTFQTKNGLDADGMAGSDTWNLLFSENAKRNE